MVSMGREGVRTRPCLQSILWGGGQALLQRKDDVEEEGEPLRSDEVTDDCIASASPRSPEEAVRCSDSSEEGECGKGRETGSKFRVSVFHV